ncbi:hypothetical protein EJD97_018438 [Solanum chilense]|uniref:Uncharacterized protein n=1 Tax=Solanum chilense TaxID=4083 RepID=A0A6N2B1Z1_SOLCI|nr:hypothetical protein EJD97_018438 [Solanum chilense]
MRNTLITIEIYIYFLTAFESLMARKEIDGPEVIELLKEVESDLMCKGKQRWPELIGVPAQYAKGIIEKENPFIADIPILLNGSPVTMDFRCDRVRLFDNILGYVVQMPVVT